MFAVNPDYIGLLFTTKIGLFMLGTRRDPARARHLLDEKDRGYRCLRSGWSSLSPRPSSPIVLIGLAVESGSSEKKRALRLLESQVSGSTESVNLREQELSKNFGQRVLVPVVGTAGRVARRVTPLDTRDRVAKKLLLAGEARRAGTPSGCSPSR